MHKQLILAMGIVMATAFIYQPEAESPDACLVAAYHHNAQLPDLIIADSCNSVNQGSLHMLEMMRRSGI